MEGYRCSTGMGLEAGCRVIGQVADNAWCWFGSACIGFSTFSTDVAIQTFRLLGMGAGERQESTVEGGYVVLVVLAHHHKPIM